MANYRVARLYGHDYVKLHVPLDQIIPAQLVRPVRARRAQTAAQRGHCDRDGRRGKCIQRAVHPLVREHVPKFLANDQERQRQTDFPALTDPAVQLHFALRHLFHHLRVLEAGSSLVPESLAVHLLPRDVHELHPFAIFQLGCVPVLHDPPGLRLKAGAFGILGNLLLHRVFLPLD